MMKIDCLTKLKSPPPPKNAPKRFCFLWDGYPNLPFWSLISDIQGLSSFTRFLLAFFPVLIVVLYQVLKGTSILALSIPQKYLVQMYLV